MTLDPITQYWYDHYVTHARHGISDCCLCGNSGIIDTRPTASCAGTPLGRRSFCICPNGQSMRRNPERYQLVDEEHFQPQTSAARASTRE